MLAAFGVRVRAAHKVVLRRDSSERSSPCNGELQPFLRRVEHSEGSLTISKIFLVPHLNLPFYSLFCQQWAQGIDHSLSLCACFHGMSLGR